LRRFHAFMIGVIRAGMRNPDITVASCSTCRY
jgi:hypothetical protein